MKQIAARRQGRSIGKMLLALHVTIELSQWTISGVNAFSTKSSRAAIGAPHPLHSVDKRESGRVFDVGTEVLLPTFTNTGSALSNEPIHPDSSGTRRDSSIEMIEQQYTKRMMMSMQKQQQQEYDEEQQVLLEIAEKRDMYIILGLLWTIAAISALDRVAMSVALIPMSTELDLSNTLKGSISSLFSVGYSIGILPAGLILATLSPRTVVAFGVAVWSIATLATPGSAEGVVVGFVAPLFLVRALVGVGESFVLPTVQRLLAVWTQPDQKSLGAWRWKNQLMSVLPSGCWLTLLSRK